MIHPLVMAAMTSGGLVLSPNTTNISFTSVPSPVFAIIEYNLDGVEYQNDAATSSSVTTSRGNWLDVGAVSSVWIERTINSGSLNNTDAGPGRLSLATSRKYGVSRSSIGTQAANVTFDFYDAVSSGNLLATVTLDLTAEVDSL